MILLNNRAVIRLSGADVKTFLQGLITNDINKLSPQALLYAAILAPQGKYLFDFIIHETDAVYLDVESSRVADFIKKLSMYKLRADVKIEDVSSEYKIYSDGEKGLPDPRNPALGKRLLTAGQKQENGSFYDYESLRISLAIPENGDLVPDKSFVMQNNFEELNGVDFKKGCYVGQEVTARTKYKGGVKKRLYALKGEGLQNTGEEIKVGEVVIGEMRSRIDDLGIAHLDIERADEYLAKL
jgi:folate-binding protein YgfZ